MNKWEGDHSVLSFILTYYAIASQVASQVLAFSLSCVGGALTWDEKTGSFFLSFFRSFGSIKIKETSLELSPPCRHYFRCLLLMLIFFFFFLAFIFLPATPLNRAPVFLHRRLSSLYFLSLLSFPLRENSTAHTLPLVLPPPLSLPIAPPLSARLLFPSPLAVGRYVYTMLLLSLFPLHSH